MDELHLFEFKLHKPISKNGLEQDLQRGEDEEDEEDEDKNK